jgi:hypothetical protein
LRMPEAGREVRVTPSVMVSVPGLSA